MKVSKKEKENLIAQIENLCGDRPLFYLKFCSCEQFANDVCNGDLYANTPIYFREQEKITGERGQGDSFELISCIETQRITMCDSETGRVIMTAPSGSLKVHFEDDNNIPIVCFTGITLEKMNLVEVDENHADFLFPFSEEEYALMEKKFGKYCVVISGRELEKKLHTYCEKENCDYIFDAVNYCHQNRIDRIQAFNDGSKKRFLYKNKDLEYQREYRFVLASQMPEDHFIRIGKLDEATILESNTLSNIKFTINYKSHKISD